MKFLFSPLFLFLASVISHEFIIFNPSPKFFRRDPGTAVIFWLIVLAIKRTFDRIIGLCFLSDDWMDICSVRRKHLFVFKISFDTFYYCVASIYKTLELQRCSVCTHIFFVHEKAAESQGWKKCTLVFSIEQGTKKKTALRVCRECPQMRPRHHPLLFQLLVFCLDQRSLCVYSVFTFFLFFRLWQIFFFCFSSAICFLYLCLLLLQAALHLSLPRNIFILPSIQPPICLSAFLTTRWNNTIKNLRTSVSSHFTPADSCDIKYGHETVERLLYVSEK